MFVKKVSASVELQAVEFAAEPEVELPSIRRLLKSCADQPCRAALRCCQALNAVHGGHPIKRNGFLDITRSLAFFRISGLEKSQELPSSSSLDKSRAKPGSSPRLGSNFMALVTLGTL